jgi:hypothetical protein
VLRVNPRGDLGRLAREARVAAQLAPEARYPGVITAGDDGELEWIAVRRVEGIVLSRAWPALDQRRRERAMRELASALRALHACPDRDLPGDGDFAPPHTLPLASLLELLERTRRTGMDAGLLDDVEGLIRESWVAFDAQNVGLVHGDTHLENVLWDGEHVSALLDLEWSRRSWIEGDLEILLSFCDHPFFFVSKDYEVSARAEDYGAVPGWLRAEYPQWFTHPRLRQRLALLHTSRTLGLLCEFPALGPLDPRNPRDRRNHLKALLSGSSYLLSA